MDIHILFEEFCQYSQLIKGYSHHTILRYRQAMRLYVNYSDINSTAEVTQQSVFDFMVHGRLTRKWNANTFINYHKSLTVFFRYCVEKGVIKTNVMDNIALPKIPTRLPKSLQKSDALKLLEIAYNLPYSYTFLRFRNHAIFATFLYAGLRKKELLGLKLTDVNLENLSILIRQGKGNKDRIIPISFTLAQILKSYLQHRKRLKKNCPEFFTSLNRNQGLTDNGLKHLLVKIRKATKIHFTWHMLRHTFATLMLEGGCDIFSLSKMMGHSDIKTTTIYLSASAEHLRSQVCKHPLEQR